MTLMNPLDDTLLFALLNPSASGKVSQPENTLFEYKAIFDRSSKEAKAKYLKELAAFHNHNGGYVVFGITDEGQLVGLNNFAEPDGAELSNDIRTYFAPAFFVSARTLQIEAYLLYIIHVEKRKLIPTVCTKSFPNVLVAGTIYWRYHAESTPITAGDLITLLHSLRGEETAKLTDIEDKRLKIENKPDLVFEGGMAMLNILKPKLVNRGKKAHLKAINVLNGNVICYPYVSFPIKMAPDQKMVFEVRTDEGTIANTTKYTLEFLYSDEIGTNYRSVGEFFGASGKMHQAEEITSDK